MNIPVQRGLAVAIGSLLGLGIWSATFIACTGAQLALDFADEDSEAYRQRVLDELAAASTPAWAGSYRWSNGYEHHALDLAPSAFWYEYFHCTGIGLLAYGTVDVVGEGRVRIHIARSLSGSEAERSQLASDGGELLSIPWGPERFVVAVERMPEFCADAAKPSKFQYKTYLYLLRGEGENGWRMPQVDGHPSVPDDFRYLLPQ